MSQAQLTLDGMGRKSRAKAERRETHRIAVAATASRAAAGRCRGCLFCRRSDVAFTSREHVLPESMGNTDLVLLNGVVCDSCNNGVLAVLDQRLCDYFPLKARRTMLGIRSKAGKVPVTRHVTGPMESPREPHVVFNDNGPAHAAGGRPRRGPGPSADDDARRREIGGANLAMLELAIVPDMAATVVVCAADDVGVAAMSTERDHRGHVTRRFAEHLVDVPGWDAISVQRESSPIATPF